MGAGGSSAALVGLAANPSLQMVVLTDMSLGGLLLRQLKGRLAIYQQNYQRLMFFMLSQSVWLHC